MATTTEVVQETTEEAVPTSLEETNYIWWWADSSQMVPVIVATDDKVCEIVEAIGYQIYYLIAEEKYYAPTAQNSTTQTLKYRQQIFKVVNNIIGRSICPTDDLNLQSFESMAWFALPKIPYTLIDRLDDFFRGVEDKYDTEAIVILTFDPEIGGEDGWGIIVPKQANTATFCDYEPESVADEKPDNVFIVGSVHSHPSMSAYASSTDHKDQATFDGIHITYGWQKSVENGATQYHIELQMAGTSFRLKPEQVFADRPKAEVNPEELEAWTAKVSKKTFNTHVTKGGATNFGSIGTGGSSGSSSYGGRSQEALNRIKCLPKSTAQLKVPDPKDAVLIASIDADEELCPFCESKLIPADFKKRRCLACHQYLAIGTENIEDMVAAREEIGIYNHDIALDKNPVKPIFVWHRLEGGGHHFEQIYDPMETSSGK